MKPNFKKLTKLKPEVTVNTPNHASISWGIVAEESIILDINKIIYSNEVKLGDIQATVLFLSGGAQITVKESEQEIFEGAI
jgi:hypothetical protein